MWKKRIARDGQGKRSGYRTIVVYAADHHAFILYGFSKNQSDNITPEQGRLFKVLADHLLSLTADDLGSLLKSREYVEVNDAEY